MKTLSFIFALLLSCSAFAATNWIKIESPEGVSVYLDDSNVIAEDGYNGFQIKTSFDSPRSINGINGIVVVMAVFEYNCHTHEGRGRRLLMIDTNGATYTDPVQWRQVVAPPATTTLEQVKARVCFKAN